MATRSTQNVETPPHSPRSAGTFYRRIGLVVQGFGDQLPKLKAGIQAYARRDGYWRLVETSRMDRRWIQSVADDVEGIIAIVSDKRYARMITSTGRPSVNLSPSLRDAYFPTVRVDDRAVGRQAAEYFLQRGYRHFAFLGSSQGPMPQRRQASFASHVKQAGHDVSCWAKSRNLDLAEVRREIGRWLASLPKPLALLASSDSLGVIALDACAEMELPVPHAVSVLGVGNVHAINLCGHLPLSTMSLNLVHRGFAAAEMLDRLIAGETIESRVVLIPPGRIITRRSSSTLAISDAVVAAAFQLIAERACDGLSVDDVASTVGVTRRSLERHFAQHLNTTPYHHIRRVRLERARSLLLDTDLTVREIAIACGMVNAENLWDAFSQAFGQSPSAFRRTPQS
jgi:LacI family transcriptional regulator